MRLTVTAKVEDATLKLSGESLQTGKKCSFSAILAHTKLCADGKAPVQLNAIIASKDSPR